MEKTEKENFEGVKKDVMCLVRGSFPKAFSDGFINNDNPLHHTVSALMANIIIMFITSRAVHYCLRPFKQPRVISHFIAGILMGPSFLGNISAYRKIFLEGENNLLVHRLLALYGVVQHMFVVGVKMEPVAVLRAGRKAIAIAVASFGFPFAMASFAGRLMYDAQLFTPVIRRVGFGNVLYVIASLSLTAFPVTADLLLELRLLNSELGRLALSVALIMDSFGWLLNIYFTSFHEDNIRGDWQRGANVLLALATTIVFLFFVFRPALQYIAHRATRGGRISDGCILIIVIVALLSAVVTDAIGGSYFAGPLIVGLIIPDGPPLGTALVKHAELFVDEMFMPLFYSGIGQLVHVNLLVLGKVREDGNAAGGLGWMVVLVLVAWVGKIGGTTVAGVYCKMPPLNAFLLGLLLNSKGLVEVLIYLRFCALEMLDELGFTVLVLMAILSTAISSRAIHSFYEPLKQTVATRRTVGSLRPQSELRTLACLHNEGPIPFLTSLLECLSSASHPLCAYVLHMVDLAGRADSTLIAHKDRRGLVNMTHMDPIMCAFVTYEQHKKGQLVVQPFTARAPFKTMYHDVCALSVEKSAHVVVVPFPRKGAMGPGGDGGGRELDQAARGVVTEVLEAATCTVGILVYEVFGYSAMPSPVDFRYDVGLLFWGGPDDREALAITMRMALHGAVAISVLRFTRAEGGHGVEEEWRQDEALLQQARAEEAVAVAEVAVSNVEETMAVIRTMNDKRHDMLVVGRRQGADSFLEGLLEWCEFPELGVIGDMLASDFKHTNSILVVQTPSRYTDSDQ